MIEMNDGQSEATGSGIRYLHCLDCGRGDVPLSRHGHLCRDCGAKRAVNAALQLHHKSGPIYLRYKAGLLVAAERIVKAEKKNQAIK